MSDRKGLNRQLFWLYEGTGKASFWFRWALLTFDLLTIGYFLWAPFGTRERGHYTIDYVIGGVIALDLAARFYIEKHRHRFFASWINWADIVVVITMFAPLLVSNFAFLRVLRAVRAVRAFTFIRRVKGLTPWFRRHERIIDKVTNLVVFVFIMAALVHSIRRCAQVCRRLSCQDIWISSGMQTRYGRAVSQLSLCDVVR